MSREKKGTPDSAWVRNNYSEEVMSLLKDGQKIAGLGGWEMDFLAGNSRVVYK